MNLMNIIAKVTNPVLHIPVIEDANGDVYYWDIDHGAWRVAGVGAAVVIPDNAEFVRMKWPPENILAVGAER